MYPKETWINVSSSRAEAKSRWDHNIRKDTVFWLQRFYFSDIFYFISSAFEAEAVLSSESPPPNFSACSCGNWRRRADGRTLCCVAARAVLHKHVVERLVGSAGQLVDPHCGDPLLAHGAFRVPAVNHTVVTRPGADRGTFRTSQAGLKTLCFFLLYLLCFMMRPTENWTSRCSGALRLFTSGVTGCFLCWMCSSVCCTR